MESHRIISVSFIVLIFIFPSMVFSMMPPDKLEKRNLEAPYILVGKIEETGKILVSDGKHTHNAEKGLFVMKVLHVIKGQRRIHLKDKVRVLFELPENPQNGMIVKTDIPHVHVEVGDIVVVYLKPSVYRPFYQPLAEGASVAIIKK